MGIFKICKYFLTCLMYSFIVFGCLIKHFASQLDFPTSQLNFPTSQLNFLMPQLKVLGPQLEAYWHSEGFWAIKWVVAA